MKKFASIALSLTLTLLMIFSALSLPMAIFAADKVTSTRDDISVITGTSGGSSYFKEDTYYDLPKLDTTPLTYEFEVAVPTTIGGAAVYGGVILGNYGKDGKRCISIEIYEYGKVRFYTNTSSGNVDIQFSKANFDPRKGKTIHIAITIDTATGTATLYINGSKIDEATNTKLKNLPKASDFPFNFRVGGDHRSGNNRHFEGTIDSVALFSDIRTPEEIAEDAKKSKSWSSETDNLIAAYDLTKQGETALMDYSGNGNTLTYTNGSGVLLKNYGSYKIENKLNGAPETLEAWVFLPKYYSGRGGTIFGNDDNNSSNSPDIAFEIEYDGHPRFYYTTASGGAVHEFGNVDLRTGTWQHVTIVHDVANKEARCYVNGVLAETLAYTETMADDNGGKQTPVEAYHSGISDKSYVLGGTNQKGNPQYFKGFLKEVRVYSDVRTDSEIAADYNGSMDKTDGNLMACYQLSQANLYNDIEDLSGNGYTAKFDQLMYDTTEPIDDYAYSLAIVGDTQTITNHNSAKLKDLYQWIVDNTEARNIQYVIGLGDITERGDRNGSTYVDEATARKQWQAAKDAITLMDGNVPYSLIRGAGHDGLDFFNEYFADHTGYTTNIEGYYEAGSVENVYHSFRVGTTDYMLLCLEFGAKDDVLEWANGVVEAHPNHRVIVTTHGYLEKDGSFLEGHETYSPSRYDPESNDGDEIWDKFVRKHANIFMVMSGHMSANDVIVSEMVGDNGNVVKQLLINPQSMDSSSSLKGMVAMLYFSADGKDVQVEYYSTLTNTWRPKTTFSITYAGQYETPYGNIPEEYKDINTYPVVVFNSETSELVFAGTQLHTANGAIQYCVNNGGKHVVYVRKNKMSCYSNTSIGSLNGEILIDLGGNTLYVKGAFLEFQGNNSSATVLKLVNGTLDMSADNAKFIGIGGKYGNGKKTNNITVENVTFKSLTKNLVYETFGDAVNTTSTIIFKDCRFEAPSGKTDKLVTLGIHSDKTRANITFEGGEFVFAGSQCDIYTTGGVALKYVYFDKNASGSYPTVTMPKEGVSTDTYTTPNGVVLGLHKLSENAASVKYQLAPFSIFGAYLNITENINVCYSAVLPVGYTDPYMVFEFRGETYTVTNPDGSNIFKFMGVTPQLIGENIKATLYATYNGETVCVEKAMYSVKEYCVNMLAKTTDAKLVTLLSDLLVYGAKAQLYNNPNLAESELVTYGLELTPSEFIAPETSDKKLDGTADDSVVWNSVALRYENAMAIKLNFKVSADYTLKISINGRTVEYKVSDLTKEGDNYVVYFRGIEATEYAMVVTATFYNAEGTQVGQSAQYSVNSYVFSKQNDTDKALSELVKATYNYGISAENYVK